MKNEVLRVKEVPFELLQESDVLGETLDFTDLMSIKGGKEDEKESSGHAGGLFCWC